MAKLTDSINTFQTGDLVFVRYPPKGTQPIHVTVFLKAGDRLGGSSYVHAGATEVEIASASTYEEDSDAGGYLHAHPTDTTLRENVANVARIFAQTAKKTPYGSYPSSSDFTRLQDAGTIKQQPKSPHASRFTGMIRTVSIDAIPFEYPALHRLLKWTFRALTNAPLSDHRGITCAAFVALCHQVARMQTHLIETGAAFPPESVKKCVETMEKHLVTKASLRQELELIAKDPKTSKNIYRDQAYRENSNRVLNTKGKALASKAKSLRDEKHATDQVDELESLWWLMQTKLLNIDESITKKLTEILGPNFMFDAKYVSSPVLADALRGDGGGAAGWNTTEYKDY